MTAGELVLIVCLAGIAGSAATMVILALREYQDYRRRRPVPPVTSESIHAAQLAAARERERFQQVTGHPITVDGHVLASVTVRGGRVSIH